LRSTPLACGSLRGRLIGTRWRGAPAHEIIAASMARSIRIYREHRHLLHETQATIVGEQVKALAGQATYDLRTGAGVRFDAGVELGE
jgi:hypothetical protein